MLPNRSTPSLSLHRFVQAGLSRQPQNVTRDRIADQKPAFGSRARHARPSCERATRYQREVLVEFTTNCCQLYLAKMGLSRETLDFGQWTFTQCSKRGRMFQIGVGFSDRRVSR